MTAWLPGVDRIPGNDSGTWAPDDETAPKVVWHTTEGSTIGGAVAAYTANNSWPHITADPVRKRLVQHVPLDRPARALRNTSAPGQTNREAHVAQIEVVCTSRTKAPAGLVSLRDLTDDQLAWLGVHVARPVSAAIGCPLTTSVTFYGDDAGWTLAAEGARQRLTAKQWDTYTGHLAHQHVPENHHWDGPFDMAAILAAARADILKPNSPKDVLDMTPDELRKIVREEVGRAIGWTRAVAENPTLADTDADSKRLADRAGHLNPERKA